MPTDILLLIVVLVWGTVFSVVKYSLAEINPMAFASVRFLAASVLMLAIVWRLEGAPIVRRQDWMRVALVGLVSIGLYQIFFTVGIHYTTASNSSLIIASAPVFTAIFSAFMGEERITLRQVLGVILSFLGVVLIVRASNGEITLSSQSLWGDLLSLGAAITTALGAVLAKDPLRRYSALRLMTWGIVIGALFMFPFATPSIVAQEWSRVSLSAWLGLGYSVVFASVIGYVFWYKAISDIGPIKTMVYGNLIPVVAVLGAALTLGEEIKVEHILGGGIILVGVTLTRLARVPATQVRPLSQVEEPAVSDPEE